MARVRQSPYAVGAPQVTPAPAPGRHANMGRNAPKEAPFAVYDQQTTGNAYREYEARHEAAPHPASAYGNAIPAPRPAPREKPFAVDDGPSGFPPSYTPQAAKKDGAYGKITGDGADRGFDPAVYAAARAETEKHGRPNFIADAPFAVGNNYAGGGAAPAYSRLQKKEGNMGKITGGDAGGFDPQARARQQASQPAPPQPSARASPPPPPPPPSSPLPTTDVQSLEIQTHIHANSNSKPRRCTPTSTPRTRGSTTRSASASTSAPATSCPWTEGGFPLASRVTGRGF